MAPRERRTFNFGPDDVACAELLTIAREARTRAATFAIEGRFTAAEACLGFAQRIEAALTEGGHEPAP